MPSDPSAEPGRYGPLTLIAAYAENRVIGRDGGIPWHLPADFAHFKATTMGGLLVMGRTTFESIGRPLPGRTTLVVTRDPVWEYDGVLVAHRVEEALALAATRPEPVFVAGGASIYAATLPFATDQVLTEVHRTVEGDTRYPAFDEGEWVETQRVPGEQFDIVRWARRSRAQADS